MLPVYIDGRTVGQLELRRQESGVTARVHMEDVGRVVRLNVYGDGASAYLGIPEPDGRGGMTLECKLRSVPEGVRCAAERETPPETPPERPARADAPPRHVVWMGGRAYYF